MYYLRIIRRNSFNCDSKYFELPSFECLGQERCVTIQKNGKLDSFVKKLHVFNSKVSPFRFACANGGTDVLVRRVRVARSKDEITRKVYPRLIHDRLQTCNFSRAKCHRVLVSTRYNRITFQSSFIKLPRDSVVAVYDNACINNNRLTKRTTGTRVDNRRIAWEGYNRALSHKRWEDKLGFFPTIEPAYSHGLSTIVQQNILLRMRETRLIDELHQFLSSLFLYRRIIEHSFFVFRFRDNRKATISLLCWAPILIKKGN